MPGRSAFDVCSIVILDLAMQYAVFGICCMLYAVGPRPPFFRERSTVSRSRRRGAERGERRSVLYLSVHCTVRAGTSG